LYQHFVEQTLPGQPDTVLFKHRHILLHAVHRECSNNTDVYGQIYAGTANISNSFYYFTPPGVPGMTLGALRKLGAYNVAVVYKRETTTG
jgi:hypothetical protein